MAKQLLKQCALLLTAVHVSSMRVDLVKAAEASRLDLATVEASRLEAADDLFGECPADNAVCVAVRFRPPNPGDNCEGRVGKDICEDVAITLNTEVPPMPPKMPDGCARCVEVNYEEKANDYYPFDVILPYDKAVNSVPSNADVAKNIVNPMMDKALACQNDGESCQGSAFFAYGATGSGKTYTMGFEEALIESNPGLLQLGMTKIYGDLARLKASSSLKHRKLGDMRVWMSFYELYGDSAHGSQVYDLLSPGKKGDGARGSQEKVRRGLTYVEVPDLATMHGIFRSGNGKRAVGGTGMNAKSSRSHALVQFFLVSKDKEVNKLKDRAGNMQLTDTLSKAIAITWIDLAGSEKPEWMDEQKWPGLSQKTRVKRTAEGKVINGGLSMLASCIAKTAGMKSHCSPRSDMLTEMLRNIFDKDKAGKALINTRMIATMNPSADPEQMELTSSTLTFASTVKKIKLAVPTGVSSGGLVKMRPDEIIADLQMQLDEMKNKVAELEQENSELKAGKGVVAEEADAEGGLSKAQLLELVGQLREASELQQAQLTDCLSKPREPEKQIQQVVANASGSVSSEEVMLLETQLEEVGAEAKKMRDAWAASQAELRNLRAQLDAPSDKELFLSQKLKDTEASLAAQKKEAGRLAHLLPNLEERMRQADGEVTKYRGEISGLEMTIQLQNEELQVAQGELEAIRQAALKEADVAAIKSEDPCELLEKNVVALQATTGEAMSELDAMFKELETTTALQARREAKITEVEAMVEHLRDQGRANGNVWNHDGLADEIEDLVGDKLTGKGAVTRQLLKPARALEWLTSQRDEATARITELVEEAVVEFTKVQTQVREAGSAATVDGRGVWPTGARGKQEVLISQLKTVDSLLTVSVKNLREHSGVVYASRFTALEGEMLEKLCSLSKSLVEGHPAPCDLVSGEKGALLSSVCA